MPTSKIIFGKTNGLINFEKTAHPWAYSLYKKCQARTWFPRQVNVVKDKNNLNTLTPDELHAYKVVLAQLVFNDSAQVRQLDRFFQYITSPVVGALVSFQEQQETVHCYIKGTKILTEHGFKLFEELTVEDKVANYTEDGNIYFTQPKQIHRYHYEHPLVHINHNLDGSNYCQVVTPNHKVVFKNKKTNKVSKQRADKVKLEKYNLPISGNSISNGVDFKFTKLAKLVIAATLSGYRNDRFEYFILRKEGHKNNKLKRYLDEHDIDYKQVKNKGMNVLRQNKLKLVEDDIFDAFKYLDFSEISSKQAKAIIKEIMYWLPKQNVVDFIEKKRILELLQTLAIICNSKINHTVDLMGLMTIEVEYDVNSIDGSKLTKTLEAQHPHSHHEVYCVTSNTGMIVCSYNNTVFISGNSESYSVMAEDILENTDEIFNMHETNDMLNKKNNAIASMYGDIYKELPPLEEYLKLIENNKVTDKDKVVWASEIAMACIANQIVEQMIFHGGFATMFSLEYKMPGTAEMIKEIYLDEIIHTEIIKFIYKAIFKELDLYNNKLFDKDKFYSKVENLMEKMNAVESEWLLYATKNLPGFTLYNIEGLINYLNYKISNNLNLPLNRLNNNTSDKSNILIKLLKERAKSEIASRTNFFEANATEYSKSTIKMDY